MLLWISDLPSNVICNIATYIDGTALFSKCGRVSYLRQKLSSFINLNLIFEAVRFEVGSELVILILGTLNFPYRTLLLLLQKWMDLSLMENHLLWYRDSPSLPNWIRVLTLSLLVNLFLRILEPWFVHGGSSVILWHVRTVTLNFN